MPTTVAGAQIGCQNEAELSTLLSCSLSITNSLLLLLDYMPWLPEAKELEEAEDKKVSLL